VGEERRDEELGVAAPLMSWRASDLGASCPHRSLTILAAAAEKSL
jgi:hypothetical protein